MRNCASQIARVCSQLHSGSMEPALQSANAYRKADCRFWCCESLDVAQQNDFTVISVELGDGDCKDGLDLLSRDLVLDEVTRICECRKHVSEILLASVLPQEPAAGISNDRE